MIRQVGLLALIGCVIGSCRRAQPAPPPQPQLSRAEATALIDAYYRRERACLWIGSVAIPHDYPVSLGHALELFDAPRAAGLVTETRTRAVVHIELTALGAGSWLPSQYEKGEGNLCFGAPRVATLDALQPVQNPVYGPAVDATFSTVVRDHAPWAELPAIAQAAPRVQLELSRPLPNVATLMWADGQWQVVTAEVHAGIAPDPALDR